jgi:hypothetical protein
LLNLSVLLLRQARPPWYDPAYESPLYPWMQIVGTIAALALIPQMGALSQISAVAFVALGVGWFYWQRSRHRILPDYGLVDQLRRVRQVRSIETKRERVGALPSVAEASGEHAGQAKIVVELVDGEPAERLIEAAGALAAKHDAWIEAVVVAEVPDQVPLFGYPADVDFAWRDEVEAQLDDLAAETELHQVLTHDRDRTLMARLDGNAAVALLPWSPGRDGLGRAHVATVLEGSPAPVALYRDREVEGANEIVVATGGGSYERTEVEIGEALAQARGARLTFVKVLPVDAADERVRNAETYLHELGELVASPAQARLVREDDVQEALVAAARDASLLIVGAAEPRGLRQGVGRLPERIAETAATPVLLVKAPSPERTWWEAIIDRVSEES